MPNKKIKIRFAPGCFDQFDGDQKELDELIAELNKMAEDGTLLDQLEINSNEYLSEEDLDDYIDQEHDRVFYSRRLH
jgi:hypothetical protein